MDSIRILHLEDSPLDADLTSAYLSRGGVQYVVDRVELREQFLRALQEKEYDLILADYALPEFDGLSALELAHRVAPQLPFIFVSGTLGEDIAIQSLHRGATDYVLKTRLDRLAPAVQRACREREEHLERLRSQDQVKESERRYSQLADAIKQLIWTTDVRGSLVYANREFLEYLGYRGLDDATANDMSLVYSQDRDGVEHALLHGLNGEKRFQMEYRLRRATDGEHRWHLVSYVPLRDQSGHPEGWVATAMDVEPQKQREQALIISEKLAATGRLAASIAHEINNPLEALANLLYLVNTREHLSAEGASYMEMAEHELMRASQITKQTLGFYRENSGFSVFEIDGLLDEVLAQYRSKLTQKNVSVEKSYRRGARVMAMRGEIRQVFANLLANAIDAVSVGGHIWLHVERTMYGNTAGWMVSVRDNGMGIPPDHVERIFQPFFTTKKDVGTGLGLWVCSEIVGKHNGRINVESQHHGPTTATEFSVFLPEKQPEGSKADDDADADTDGMKRGSAA